MSDSDQKAGSSPQRRRGRPKSEDLAELDARLLAAGRELFFQHGYGAMTMSELAIVARVSKTTLYARFPAKADLFRAILAQQMQRWDTGPEHRSAEGCKTLLATLRLYGDQLLRAAMTSDFAQVNRLLYSESGRFPELAEIAAERIARGTRYLAQRIGFFAEHEGIPCRDADGAAELFMALIMGRGSFTIVANRPLAEVEREAWLETMLRAFLGGRASW